MRAKEMRERSQEELLKMKLDTKGTLFSLRLKNATHQLDKTGAIKTNRKEIARIETILREKASSSPAEENEE